MRFKIPGRDTYVRLFEPVQTNTPYRFVDLGIEYADGTMNSLAIGGSFTSLESWIKEDQADKAAAAEQSVIGASVSRAQSLERQIQLPGVATKLHNERTCMPVPRR